MVFEEYGIVDKVVILARSNNRENKFGLFRFFKVMDEDMLVVQLDNIFLANQNMFANISCFRRESKGGDKMVSNLDVLVKLRNREVIIETRYFRDERSYAAATRNLAEHSNKEVIHLANNLEDEEIWNRFNKALMEVVEKVGLNYIIQDIFDMEG